MTEWNIDQAPIGGDHISDNTYKAHRCGCVTRGETCSEHPITSAWYVDDHIGDVTDMIKNPPRDAEADMAVCEAATPGEWIHVMHKWDNGVETLYRNHMGTSGLLNNEVAPTTRSLADGRFIALARTALPYWIAAAQAEKARADKAEADNRRLREALEEIIQRPPDVAAHGYQLAANIARAALRGEGK